MSDSLELPLGGQLWLAPKLEKAHGTVLVCPGGGYQWLSPREDEPVALAFRKGGWNSAVLRYTVRTPDQPALGTLPLGQLGQAVAWIRENFPGPVVVCGFSAGGHLACSLGAHWKTLRLPRPDGMILAYPVVTGGEYAHRGSFLNLAEETEWDFYSLEKQVGAHTPPAFIWHTLTDPEVPAENSFLLVQALRKAHVSCEFHLYPHGVHGLSLATPQVEEPEKQRFADPHVAGWMDLCLDWLREEILTKE